MVNPAAPTPRGSNVGGRALAAALVIGLAVRLVILWQASALGPKIADEQQYVELAGSILRGQGLAWSTGELTSLRPPLYPALVAGIWSVAGEGNLQAVRIVQIVLALFTAALVYELGRRAFTPAVGRVAAVVVWLYPSLLYLNFTILTETLFTFFLVAFVLLGVMVVQQPRGAIAVGCGLALGLGALTRSVLWPLPVVLCPLLALLIDGPLRRRLTLPALVFVGYAAVVVPWAVRNTRLQNVVTIVDTMGGMNLRMGNYEHTPEDRMWDAVSLKGDRNWVYALTQEPPSSTPSTGVFTEGMKDKWAQRKAIEYIRANPGTTLRRAAIKFSDLWGLDRSFVAGVQQGLYHPPTWFVVLATLLTLASSALVMILGAAGIWVARPQWRAHILLLLPLLVITGVHAIVFGHPRYHDPLIPVLALYAAALVHTASVAQWSNQRAALAGAVCSVAMLLAIWARQVIVVDGERIRAFLQG